jgi:FtsH-binding integral membrane protein
MPIRGVLTKLLVLRFLPRYGGMGEETKMFDWLKAHIFIAAWASPIIALVALLLKKTPEGSSTNWSRVMVYVGFLSALAILVTPGVDGMARGTAAGIAAVAFGAIMNDMRRN